ncbi:MAG: hypothetical protein ACRDQU_10010 [Pseudonocardiaceae bacterium]
MFAERGARTVGMDISPESIKQASRIAAAQCADVEYVQSNVYDAAAVLAGRTFDVPAPDGQRRVVAALRLSGKSGCGRAGLHLHPTPTGGRCRRLRFPTSGCMALVR